ncbi:hypothetical protein [Microcoleus sp. A2-C2]
MSAKLPAFALNSCEQKFVIPFPDAVNSSKDREKIPALLTYGTKG